MTDLNPFTQAPFLKDLLADIDTNLAVSISLKESQESNHQSSD